MKHKRFYQNCYYTIEVMATVWEKMSKGDDKPIEDSTHGRFLKNIHPNVLMARHMAMKDVKSLIDYFEEQPLDLELPAIMNWNTKAKKYMKYDIRVNFVKENNTEKREEYLIYDSLAENDGNENRNEELKGLIKEHEILLKKKIDLKQFEKEITYFLGLKKKKAKAKIIPFKFDFNGYNLIEPWEIADSL